jgi:hypothetical protein
MSNVRHINSHILGSGGAMRKLTERDIDAQIASNRERFHDTVDHFGEFERRKEQREPRRQPLVHQTDNSLLARAIRALRWALQLKGPTP